MNTNSSAENDLVWSGQEIIDVTGGKWISGANNEVDIYGVCYYPEQIRPGDLAVATTPTKWGGRYPDTTNMIEKFHKAGTAAVMVDKVPTEIPPNFPVLQVDNTCTALIQLANAARERFTGIVVSITGSVGKTSTKEALRHVLRQRATTHANRTNFNIYIQTAVSLAQTPANYNYGIYEFAVEGRSRTLPKAKMIRPHIAMITDIQPAHLDYYETLEALADQKSLLFDGLEPGGTAILNHDAPLFERLLLAANKKGAARVITYGTASMSDIRLIDYNLDAESSRVRAVVRNKQIDYSIGLPGRHMVINSLAVLATLFALDVDLEAIQALATMPVINQRNQRISIPLKDGHFELINDAYNANPASMRAAFEYLQLIKPCGNGRRIAVLGDMTTSGKESKQYHADLANPIIKAGIDKIYCIGKDIEHLYHALPMQIKGIYTNSGDELKAVLANDIHCGDVVLVKGSNNSDINKYHIVRALRNMDELQSKTSNNHENQADREKISHIGDGAKPIKAVVTQTHSSLSIEPKKDHSTSLSKMTNTPLWSGHDLALATQGQWISGQAADVIADNICFSSRRNIKGYAVLIAKWIKAYLDINQHINELHARGAAVVITDECPTQIPPNLPVLLVANTRNAIDDIGKAARIRFTGKIICVTGSVGKTSTIAALRHALSEQGLAWSSKSNNNHAAWIPMNLARTPQNYDYGIYEFSVDMHKRTRQQAQLMRPNVALITDIQPDHLLYYPTLEELAQQKAELFAGLEPGGIAVLNRDSEFFQLLKTAAEEKGAAQIISFGLSPFADVRLIDYTLEPDASHAHTQIDNQYIDYKVAIPGRHMLINTLGVLAVIKATGGDWQKAAASFATLPFLLRRNQRRKIKIGDNQFELIDDTFSANPASMRAAFEYIKLIIPESNGRRIAILGDMRELGKNSAELHAELSSPLVKAGFDKVFTIGNHIKHLYENLPAKIRGIHSQNVEELSTALAKNLQANDVVLVKGSMRAANLMGQIIEALHTLSKSQAQLNKKPQTKSEVSANYFTPIELPANNKAERFEILLVGDTSFGENYQERLKQRGKGSILEKEGYDYPLQNMKNILDSADLVIANLETPITDLKTSPFENEKAFIHWTHVEKTPKSLLKHNIQVVNLANNHMLDYGQDGFHQTLDILSKHHIHYFGADKNYENQSLPFVAHTMIGTSDFNFAVVGAHGSVNNGINPLSTEIIANTIKSIKNNNPNTFIILSPHWGPNYKWKTPKQTQFANALLDAGADVIIGHGAHMLQEIEKMRGRWVIFSIGNFMFNSTGRYAAFNAPPYSLIAKLLVKAHDNKQNILLRLYPIITDNRRTNYQSRFVTESEFNEVCQLLTEKNPSPETLMHALIRNKDDHGYYIQLTIK